MQLHSILGHNSAGVSILLIVDTCGNILYYLILLLNDLEDAMAADKQTVISFKADETLAGGPGGAA